MDPLIKALAPLEVVTMTSEEPDLDEIFLAYYGATMKAELLARIGRARGAARSAGGCWASPP